MLAVSASRDSHHFGLRNVPPISYVNILAGDADGDGRVSISDVALTVSYVTGAALSNFNVQAADVNMDGDVDNADITLIAAIILRGGCPDDNHPHTVDLGLPSGTCWSCCNVGADSPEAAGRYFAWGECYEHNPYLYNWDMYPYGDYDDDEDFSRLVDIGSDIAATDYDAARHAWGAPWQMPTLEQFAELIAYTRSAWVTVGGTAGRLFTGRNGATLFLPAAGDRWYFDHMFGGTDGLYWSATLVGDYPAAAHFLGFTEGSAYTDYYFRYAGFPVRPVSTP